MTLGVRDLFIAKCAEGAGGETYGAPRRLAKAIKIGMTTTTAEATLYADDSVDYNAKEFVKGEVEINANDISDEDEAEILGRSADANGVTFGGGDDEAPYYAVGFRAKTRGGKFKYIWLYKVKFAIPDETYDTKGESITINTPTIKGTFVRRDSDGKWNAKFTGLPTDAVAVAWFSAVYESAAAQAQQAAAQTTEGYED